MFLEIPDVLTPQEVGQLRKLAAGAKFVDGRISNPHSKVKNNQQLDQTDPAYATSASLVHTALLRSEQVRLFAFPKFIAPPLLTRHASGQTYGAHSDAAFMNLGGQRMLRSDLSCTVFLSDPSSYEGGALAIHLGGRRIEFRPKPGGAVLYPSTTIHEVTPVTAGERLVAITFMESQIVDQTHRELVYELNEVLALEGYNISWDNRTRLAHVATSLHRLWGSAG